MGGIYWPDSQEIRQEQQEQPEAKEKLTMASGKSLTLDEIKVVPMASADDATFNCSNADPCDPAHTCCNCDPFDACF